MTEAMKLALLISACLLLAGFIISALLVSSAQKERQKRSARMALVVSPHLREQRPEVSAIIVASKARDWSLARSIHESAPFGCPERRNARPAQLDAVFSVARAALEFGGIGLFGARAPAVTVLRVAGCERLCGTDRPRGRQRRKRCAHARPSP